MLVLRVILAIASLVAATQLVLAHPSHSQRLAASNRELDALCARVSAHGILGTDDLKARILGAWRRRMALLARLPAVEKTAALNRTERFRECVRPVQADLRYAPEPTKTTKRTGYKKKSVRYGSRRPDSVQSAPEPYDVPDAQDVRPEPPQESALEDFFPWPPPTPTDRRPLRLSQLGGAEPKTWGDVADRLIALFTAAQYPSWGFYAAPGGFAVIPRVEQLDETGKTVTGAGRFATDVQLASIGFFRRLFAARLPEGLFRAFVFVLTTDPRTSGEVSDPRRMLRIAQRWGTSGAVDLPQSLRSKPLEEGQRLFLILYEFESQVGGKTTLKAAPLPPTADQLKDAGIGLQP